MSAVREAIEAVLDRWAETGREPEVRARGGMRPLGADRAGFVADLVAAVEAVPAVPLIEGNGSIDGVTPILFFEAESPATFALVGTLYDADEDGQHVRITIDDGLLKWKVGEGTWCPGYPTERPNGGNG